MKVKGTISIVVIIMILMVGCSGNSSSEVKLPPVLILKINDDVVTYEMTKLTWNEVDYKQGNPFAEIMSNTEVSELPYYEFYSVVKGLFGKEEPNKLIMYDYILTETGDIRYDSKSTMTKNLEVIEGGFRFNVESNPAAMLSSNSKDYEKGATIRGIRIDYYKGDNQCSYSFVIRTDA